MNMKVLVATRNRYKLEEIRSIFRLHAIELVAIGDIPSLPEVDEDGSTFESNAIKKALVLALASKLWTLADDSGLQVTCLNGAPGVRSARYAGEPVDYAANNEKLLREMDCTLDRSAKFCCAIALASPSGRSQVVTGSCEGKIIDSLRGDKGFGYDPLFVPNGYDKTFGEMDNLLKNSISHRAVALRLAAETWGEMLKSSPDDWTIQARRGGKNEHRKTEIDKY